MCPVRLVILHSPVAAGAPADEQDTLVQLEAVSRALGSLGHEVTPLACQLELGSTAERLRALAPELVFNLVEALEGTGRFVHYAPGLLDHLGLGYTGCPAEAIALSSNKLTAKQLMRGAGLPTPRWISEAELAAGLPPPPGRLILKSVWEHASIGLDDQSVLEEPGGAALAAELERRRASLGGGGFAEQFIAGREFNLSLLETAQGFRVLPVAELCFDAFPDDKPRLVGFAAKWDGDSFEYAHTRRSFALAEADRRLADELSALALRCVPVFGLRGWARVDFRVDASGRPFILEVNANPCLSPDAGFAAAAAEAGLTYAELIDAIVTAASAPRGPAVAPRAPRQASRLSFRTALTRADRDRIGELVAGTGFFSPAEVAIAVELCDAALAKGATESGYHFLLADEGTRLVGYSCFGPIPATAASWDLYWIAVDRSCQSKGYGRVLLAESERAIAALGGRNVYVETSGRTQYTPTRRFYETNAYDTLARYLDFYADGDDKVVYVKRLR